MKVNELVCELDFVDSDASIYLEFNGVVYEIQELVEDSQGVYLMVDTATEERQLR